MEAIRTPAAKLVIVHTDPKVLTPWLTAETRRHVCFVAGDDPIEPARRAEHQVPTETRLWDLTTSSELLVDWLPLDGPRSVVPLAIRALQHRRASIGGRAAVVPLPMDGSPPSLEVLRTIAAAELLPAADLRRVRWISAEGIWWCQGDRSVRLPLATLSGADRRRSAEVLCSLRGFEPTSPAGAWVQSIAEGVVAPALRDWSAALASHYVAITYVELSSEVPRTFVR